jgi:hypothetical protein
VVDPQRNGEKLTGVWDTVTEAGQGAAEWGTSHSRHSTVFLNE